MRGHVVGCIEYHNGRLTGARFTLARWDVGTVTMIGARGTAIRHFSNLATLARYLRGSGNRYDVAVIDDPQEESRFLEGMDAAAQLIDPPPMIKLAA
jgi:hypothetical protein